MADQVTIRETISVTTTNITEEDKALGSEFNRVAFRALAQADRYLTYGPETARLTITRAFLQSLSRLSAIDSKSEIEEHRTSFLLTLAKMTEIQESQVIVTPDEIYDAATHAPLPSASTRRTHDQDHSTPIP